jgi:hypothetical protein
MAVNSQCAVTQAYAPRREFVFFFPLPAAGSARHTNKRLRMTNQILPKRHTSNLDAVAASRNWGRELNTDLQLSLSCNDA